jgi:hypothetical protein
MGLRYLTRFRLFYEFFKLRKFLFKDLHATLIFENFKVFTLNLIHVFRFILESHLLRPINQTLILTKLYSPLLGKFYDRIGQVVRTATLLTLFIR